MPIKKSESSNKLPRDLLSASPSLATHQLLLHLNWYHEVSEFNFPVPAHQGGQTK